MSYFFTEVNTSGLEFTSGNSYYRKIVGSANVFSHYASKCKGKFSSCIDYDSPANCHPVTGYSGLL